ncbi:MAG: GAF domain-containing sensor histidine kinase [Anaerolineae bacterium]|nr:GAF domain-containing sensor histidine kinase [Anaerolineae bacterium]
MSESAQATRVKRLEQIIEISRALNSTLNLQLLLDAIIQAACDFTNTEASSIMLLDRKSGDLHFEAATGVRSAEIATLVVPMDSSVAGWVVQHGQPLIVADARSDPRFFQQIDDKIAFETRSLVVVPMAVKGKLIGVLEVVNKKNCETFSEDDVDLLVVLADQAAVAIENAFLFQQSDLVAEIVHEMRTPLTSIAGYAEMIQRRDVSDAQRIAFAGTIQREAARLARLASDFLDLARMESGRAHLNEDRILLDGVLEETLEVLRPQAEDKGVVLYAQVPASLPALVGDRERIHQALINLVGNAIKYCRPGDSVTVAAAVDGARVLVRVIDTGPGIPKAAQDRLFQRFYRVMSLEGAAEGTGLGLAITQKIVESHGGRIWMESTEGEGTTVSLTLPVK